MTRARCRRSWGWTCATTRSKTRSTASSRSSAARYDRCAGHHLHDAGPAAGARRVPLDSRSARHRGDRADRHGRGRASVRLVGLGAVPPAGAGRAPQPRLHRGLGPSVGTSAVGGHRSRCADHRRAARGDRRPAAVAPFADQLGVVPDPASAWLPLLLVIVGGLVVSVAVAQVPAVLAARGRPSEGLRTE